MVVSMVMTILVSPSCKSHEHCSTVVQNGSELFKVATNDFEDTVFVAHPEISEIKQRLLDAGAVYAAMSGSGSTVFGLFEHDAEGSTDAQLRLLHEEFAQMVIFDDTLG